MLNIVKGDILTSDMQTITIPVNTVGVMGKGLALQFKKQFPVIYLQYRTFCKEKKLQIGKPMLYKGNDKWYLFFPTKKHWRERSNIKEIEKGLKWIIDNYKREGIKSIAIPALGCGLGQLKWDYMEPIFSKYLSNLNIPVELYMPLSIKYCKQANKINKNKYIERLF